MPERSGRTHRGSTFAHLLASVTAILLSVVLITYDVQIFQPKQNLSSANVVKGGEHEMRRLERKELVENWVLTLGRSE